MLSYKVRIVSLVYLLLLLVSRSAFAEDTFDNMKVITGLSFGYSELSFPEKLDHNISFPSANIPIAISMGSWQLSLNASVSLSDADIAEEEDTGEASREDYDLTLGYRLNRNWSIFTGYKYGNTDMNFTPRDIDEDDEEERNTLVSTSESYSQEGPFIGASYSWQFEKAGRLSVSVAYAYLNATNKFSANTDEDELEELAEFDDLTGRVKGDTDGFSYSLNWTMPISTNLLFQTRFKVNDYQQDITVDGVRFNNIDETFTTLHVGIAYIL